MYQTGESMNGRTAFSILLLWTLACVAFGQGAKSHNPLSIHEAYTRCVESYNLDPRGKYDKNTPEVVAILAQCEETLQIEETRHNTVGVDSLWKAIYRLPDHRNPDIIEAKESALKQVNLRKHSHLSYFLYTLGSFPDSLLNSDRATQQGERP